jgi:hypothetical protein
MTEVQNVLRVASTIACGIVIAAFAMWATDEGRSGSDQQIARLSQSDGPNGAPNGAPVTNPAAPVAAPAPEAEHGGVRGAIEDADDALLSPFDHVAQDGGPWAAHIFPALLALLTYGLLARILIAYVPR